MVLIDKAALLNKIATEVHYDSEHSLEMYAKMLSLINDAPTQKSVGNALEALEATDETNSMKPYRDEEGHWAIDSNPYRSFEQYAKERDFVEVVRCKDCKHYFADPWGWGSCVFEGGVSRRTKETDFCSWGERREDAETN